MLAALSLPYFHLGSLDLGIPIQSFGMIVAAGVLIGAALLRRYAEWHGISDDHIRGLTGWITVAGFIGAHEFDMIAYNWSKIGETVTTALPKWWPSFLPDELFPTHWPLPLRFWEGISSYGGFIGGAIGFAIYVWWKRLPARLFADTAIVGLLPAFSIGRIGCTMVSDHIGAAVDRGAWYAGLAMNYPIVPIDQKPPGPDLALGPIRDLANHNPSLIVDNHLLAWNLGLVEFLYLLPVNALILFLAFRSAKRVNTGLLIVITGMLYAPVRFFLDFLRPEDTDPRHLGLTFAQWASFLAFGAAAYVAVKIFKNGTPAETVTKTSGEAQRRLKMILNEDIAEPKKVELEAEALDKADPKSKKKADTSKATVKGKK